MRLKYLLDTNVVSEPIRPNPNGNVLAELKKHRHEIAIPAVVWHELLFGRERLPPSAKRDALDRYLQQVIAVALPILPYDEDAAMWHAAERSRLTTIGKTPAFADAQIAAIANANDLILVTHNTRDFADFQGLNLADWHK